MVTFHVYIQANLRKISNSNISPKNRNIRKAIGGTYMKNTNMPILIKQKSVNIYHIRLKFITRQ